MSLGRLVDLVVVAIMLVAALRLTFHRLGFQSLWLDEGAAHQYVTTRRVGALLLDLFRPSQAYPLYHLVLKLATRVLGDVEWALRLPSAVAGGLAVPALYLLGAELRGRVVGLGAAALLLLAPWGLRQAQDAKAYSLALLVVILVALTFARALRLGTRRAWLLWAAVAIVAPFAHRLLLLSLLGCAACWAIFQPRARRWPALFAAAAAAVLLIAGIAGALRYQRAESQFAPIGPLRAAALTFAQFSTGQFAGAVPRSWLVPFGLLALLGALAWSYDLRQLWRAGRSREAGWDEQTTRNRRGAALMLLAGGLPLALFLVLLALQPLYESRYLVGVYPFWLLLLAWPLAALAGPHPEGTRPSPAQGAPTTGERESEHAHTGAWYRPGPRLALPGLAVVVLGWALYAEGQALIQPGRGIFSGDVIKEDYRSAVRRLAEHVHPDDLVLLHPGDLEPLYRYYARRVTSQPMPEPVHFTGLFQAENFGPAELDRRIRPLLRTKKRAWLLIAPDHARVIDPPPTPEDEVGWIGLAFQYGDREGRIQCGEQPYAGFVGLRLYCNNLPDIAGSVPEPAVKLDVTFADQLRLRGYSLIPFAGGPRPGGTLPISLFWEPLASLEATDYVVFLHLTLPDDPRPLAQTDGRPMEEGQPTSRWTQPLSQLHDDRTIPLPPGLAPGRYVLRLGLYRAADGERVDAESSSAPVMDDAVVLGEVEILAP